MKYHIDSVILAEQSLLGALMQEPEKLVEVKAAVDVEDFYDEKNKDIYNAILRLDEAEIIPDTTTIFEEINNSGAFKSMDASLYIVELYDITPSTRNIMHYANLVKRYSIYREIRSALLSSTEEMNQGNADIDSLTATLFDQVERAMERAKTSQFKNMKDVTNEVFQEIVARMSGEGQNIAIPTGFSTLDQLVGLGKGDLVILAARPSMGKTAFALNIALNVAGKNHRDESEKKTVALFSLEMGADQLVSRMICSEGMLDSEKIKKGTLDNDDMMKLETAVHFLNQKNIFIEDSAFIKVNEVKAKCKLLKNEHGLDLIVIDYLQLLQGSKRTDNRQQEVSEISRSLKQMARELECPVIALSQLSRSVESRHDKRPMMSDLRESGSIEQDADIVSFLYRSDYYRSENADENEVQEPSDVSTVEVIVAKNRNGQTGTAELAFMKRYNRFVSKSYGE
ncbi:replicative DNA helicase [Gemella sanguinis M325]|uniref:Replicative DNA helicase n=1 Tax=Gemella sanguinis TaxID=84135 RepID=A0ABX6FJ63_9BACL|nr:replicative DNA helicase [Gemella sanguinis]EGF88321.1 replicative DNA helicase [Gemella sanguinis M325]QGS07318.1 replicative DNA helicase [Gemella sanguinis]